jgi:cyclin B
VGAMMTACKYEEIYSPEVKDFVYISDKAYTKDDIIKMEMLILNTIEFNVNVPTSWRFMERYASLISAEA